MGLLYLINYDILGPTFTSYYVCSSIDAVHVAVIHCYIEDKVEAQKWLE